MAPFIFFVSLAPALLSAVSALPSGGVAQVGHPVNLHGLLSRQATCVPSWVHVGCFTDNINHQRSLTGASTAADDMTVEKCASFCHRFAVFGLEYGRECFCGDALAPASTENSDGRECSFPCAGNSGQRCGAGDRLNIYKHTDGPHPRTPALDLPGVTHLGCFLDVGARVLPRNVISADDMTAAKCAVNCASFEFFGTEYGRECYCGSVLPTAAAPAAECSMPCTGDDDELCGAGNRLNVYRINANAQPTPVPTTTAAAATGTTPA